MKRRIAKAVRQDRAKWVEEKVQEIRRADAAGNTKAIYDAVRRIAGRARKPPQDLPGAPRVHEDFWRGVLGQERPEAPAEMQETATWKRCQQNLGEEPSPEERWSKTLTETPTAEEVAAAVQGLKKGKSYAGLLPAEFFCGSKLANRILYEVVKKIFEGDDIPPGWLKAAITLLHKGGKKADPGNYRPVALLTVGEKLIALVIFNRVKEDAYARIDKRQKGSVRGMSCRHAVFQILRDMERAIREEQLAIYTFIDFRKAYDSLEWKRMHAVLRRAGMPATLGRVIEAVYDGATYELRLGQDRTAEVAKQKSGIRQGSSLSPLLFIICLNFAMKNFCHTMAEERQWSQEEALHFALTWLGYVDDLVTKTRSEEEAAFALRELAAACRFIGLELNTKKTEAMTFGMTPEVRNNEEAMMEKFYSETGDRGWLVDYDGIDNREEWRAKAKAARRRWREEYGRPSHWLVWDTGAISCCRYSGKGWAHTEAGEKFRVTRLGMRRHVISSRDKFVCDRCGDVLADAKALRHHVGSGFCRPVKDDEQLRQLRVGRHVEEKQKADTRKKLIVPARLEVGGEEVRTVGAFRYLGTTIDNCARTEGEIQRRTAMATTTVRQLRAVWRDGSLDKRLKASLYAALVNSVALYNAETWMITAADWKTLRRFQLNSLKAMAGERPRWMLEGAASPDPPGDDDDEAEERRSREELCRALEVPDIETIVREKRVAWAAHAMRDESAEGSGARIKRECSEKTPWGRQLLEDLQHYAVEQLESLGAMDAATVRKMMTDARPTAGTRRRKRNRRNRVATERTEAMREERSRRLEELAEERRKKKEEAEALLRRINNKKWVKSPNAGEGMWRLVEDETVVFKVSLETFCENTGRDCSVVEQTSFYREPDGRYYSHLIGND
jgi:hypothetical protein